MPVGSFSLATNVPIVDAGGRPTTQFQRLWQGVAERSAPGGVPPGYYVRTGQLGGWSTPTGTFARGAYAAYAAPTAAGSYSQAQAQALMDGLQAAARHLAALIADLKSQNLLSS